MPIRPFAIEIRKLTISEVCGKSSSKGSNFLIEDILKLSAEWFG
jgi:hypothetical protein